MPDKDKSLNIDINKGGQDSNIEKGVRTHLNEAYIPDFEFTPPTPDTPTPIIVDSSSGSAATSASSGSASE